MASQSSLRTEDDAKQGESNSKSYLIQGGLLLAGVGLMSAGAGFGATLGAVRKREREILSSAGFESAHAGDMLAHEAGTRLAVRALGWGTILAVGGVSLISYAIWKLSGANNFAEFRMKMGSILPKNKNPGKSEFESLQDFLDYISKSPVDS